MPDLPSRFQHEFIDDLPGLRREWIWFLILGIALAVVGSIAIIAPFIPGIAVVIVIGVLMMAAGLANGITAFWSPRWSGLFLQLVLSILYLVVGFMLVDQPLEGAALLALLVAVFLMVGGMFRLVAAITLQFRGWGWALLNGVISILLGVVIWRNLEMGAWLIGIFVGVEMIFAGWTWIMFALAVRALRDDETPNSTSQSTS